MVPGLTEKQLADLLRHAAECAKAGGLSIEKAHSLITKGKFGHNRVPAYGGINQAWASIPTWNNAVIDSVGGDKSPRKRKAPQSTDI
ncbi:hypothetical protein B0T16DRAFT_445583 [Cercophora newfieldiana]|uniref:Uncharacterized protein n=1 Tax=Cercophora newfieldiana TaxID=92897 RepID=A0AA39YDL9_9PEZI|nr:hypothetical protein B0T16DRAFT_445583 [Cercophora newfieldiana]